VHLGPDLAMNLLALIVLLQLIVYGADVSFTHSIRVYHVVSPDALHVDLDGEVCGCSYTNLTGRFQGLEVPDRWETFGLQGRVLPLVLLLSFDALWVLALMRRYSLLHNSA